MKKYGKKKVLNTHCMKKPNPLESVKLKKRTYNNLTNDWLDKLIAMTDEQKQEQMLLYSAHGNKRMVKKSFEAMENPNINCTMHGDNCLTLASRSGDFATVKYLVGLGIDIDYIGSDEKSALHTYASKGLFTQTKFLLDNFANANVLGFMEQTPLFEAVINDKPEIIRLLAEYGANLDHQNAEGIAPIMTACQNKNRQESLLTLLNLGANIEVQDNNYRRPLSYAIKSNNRQFIDILIKRKCELNYQDIHGVSPLMLAAKYGQKETLRVLLSKGANIYLKDENENTALDYAVKFNHLGSVDILRKAHKIMEQGDKDLTFFGKQNRIANSCVR